MAKGSRKNHGTAFKARVSLEAIKEQQTLSELVDRFQVHRNQIAKWKKQLLDRVEEIFAKGKTSDVDPSVDELHDKIGRLAMENDFLSVALGRIGDTSAKR